MDRPLKFAFIDVETTGIDPLKHGIIQIAGIYSCADETKIIDKGNFFSTVAPFRTDTIDSEALKVTHTTREQVLSYESPKKVHKLLLASFDKVCNKFDKFDKMFFMGYNAQFDFAFLRRWFEKVGDRYFGSWFWTPPIDVMSLAVVYLARERYEMPDFKLSTVASRMGIPHGKAHDALSDVKVTREIFARILNAGVARYR